MISKCHWLKQCIWILLLTPTFLTAQINKSDTLDVKVGLDLSGFYQDGNVDTKIFRAKQNFSVKAWEKVVFKTQNSYVFQEFGKEKADEDILSLNFLYLNPDNKVSPFLLAFASTNFRREIDLRYLVGAGATVKVFEGEKDFLKFSLSSEYEKTEFSMTDFNINEYDGNEVIDTFRGTLWINGRYNIVDEKIIFTHESYMQPSLEHSNNYRFQADLGLEFPIWKFLNLKTNYLHYHETIVIQDQKRQDRFFTLGFSIKNYK